MKKKKRFVIDLGGSIAFPEKINIAFLRRFYFFIKKEAKRGNKFIIIIGGGEVARRYQKAVSRVVRVSDEDKHWLGIHATRLNAHLLRTIFKKEANPIIFNKRFKIKKFGRYPIIIGAGWQPGWTTDFVAVQIACDFNIDQVIALGKPAYVYTADPEKNKGAKSIREMSWKDYLKLVPSKCKPGSKAPVDPVAAKLAKRNNIKVVVASGQDLNNFKKIIKGEKFKGTTLNN